MQGECGVSFEHWLSEWLCVPAPAAPLSMGQKRLNGKDPKDQQDLVPVCLRTFFPCHKRGPGGRGRLTWSRCCTGQLLVELENKQNPEGVSSTDLSGDAGAVGRLIVSSSEDGKQDVHVDLKGVLYSATLVPTPGTLCVLSVGPSEAKVESLPAAFRHGGPPPASQLQADHRLEVSYPPPPHLSFFLTRWREL